MQFIALVLVGLISLCASQPIGVDVLPFDDPLCVTGQWIKWDKTSSYKASANVTKKLCTRSYVDVCVGPQGLLPCNQHYGTCMEVGYAWDDAVLFPNGASTVKPSVCASNGAFMTADVKVLVIAEVMFGFFFFLVVLAFVIIIGKKVGGYSLYVVLFQVLMSMLLMFSYFYLNGIVQLAAAVSALGLFRPRKPVLTGVGILILLSAFFWVTYRAGLGNVQHQSRFTAGLAISDTYEDYCVSYYRGYFDFNEDLRDIGENPAQGAWGYCSRNWLAAELFFQIFAQTLLVLQAATGIQALFFEESAPEKNYSETEPAQPQN